MTTTPTRWAVGCMTGTSLDGLDSALVKVTGTGLALAAELVAHHATPLDDRLAATLRSLAEGTPHPAEDFLRASRALGQTYARGIRQLLDQQPDTPDISLVAAHGQTIWHIGDEHLSWQLFDPWPVVHDLNLPVVYDLRQADLISGGQGAPITPITDPILYGRDQRLAVINLGGICNYTLAIPEADSPFPRITAGDLCPCNLLLDGLTRTLLNQPYDRNGEVTATGTPNPQLIQIITTAVGNAPTTLGREQFGQAWVDDLLAASPDTPPADWLASACAYIGQKLSQTIEKHKVKTGVLAGGGALNHALTRAIADASSNPDAWTTSDQLGIPSEAREAASFAILGILSADAVPITLTSVTGAQNPRVAGTWVWPNRILG
ncbi:anhydro-N-acetylmuramic acid kinase [Mucisphaera calidilacus]|uniref:Anhydro-N-acetylmuramic acid kinase n=1 Tax=Mucisphaera calidilacus TaxID=2527982 RepID=A0A518C0Y3_9BACT|nr:anhydro-N-acetylmuramic acid kinase [Mucisphaera calidilacus]QDU72854.1 Anhydro-N-acetylmuramic acid kinase [Mucisphaera calidilacus]